MSNVTATDGSSALDLSAAIVAGDEHRPLARLFARVALRVSGGAPPSQPGQQAGWERVQ